MLSDSAREAFDARGLFWLNDRQWACIVSHLPTNLTGPERDDDRRIIGGIIHMIQCGASWRDCPPEYGPYTTICNRFNRWCKRGRWGAIFEALANCGKHSVTLSIRRITGGARAGDRPLTRWTHQENPRAERP